MPLPLGTLLFSGFGDEDLQATDAAGVPVTPPVGARIGNTTGITGGLNGCTGFLAISGTQFFVVGTSYNEFPNQIVEAILDATLLGYVIAVPNTAPPYVSTGQTSGASMDAAGNAYWLSDDINKTTPLGVQTVVGTGLTGSFANGRLGVNQAGTIAYYAKSTDAAVSRWDLQTDLALSDLVSVTGGGGHKIGAICVLSDDTILVGWDVGTSGATVVRYDAAGAVLTTYTLPDTYDRATWIAAAVDLTTGAVVSDRFVVAYYSSAAGYGVTVAEVETATGTVLSSFATPAGTFEWDGPFALSRELATPAGSAGCVVTM